MTPKATRGIGRYIEELVRAMLQLAPEHEYVLVTNRTLHPFASHPSVETVVADVPWYGVAEQFRMPGIFRSLRADVLHVPHWNVPVLTAGPLVITVHDLLLRHESLSARISTRNSAVAAIIAGLFTGHWTVGRRRPYRDPDMASSGFPVIRLIAFPPDGVPRSPLRTSFSCLSRFALVGAPLDSAALCSPSRARSGGRDSGQPSKLAYPDRDNQPSVHVGVRSRHADCGCRVCSHPFHFPL